mmetsp:Transcript_98801/g.316728  ORF Transcript_98801/g.316728 Transcript_98801/m.316728 type:complete len:279 (-) Transcript_98801:3-839(-)
MRAKSAQSWKVEWTEKEAWCQGKSSVSSTSPSSLWPRAPPLAASRGGTPKPKLVMPSGIARRSMTNSSQGFFAATSAAADKSAKPALEYPKPSPGLQPKVLIANSLANAARCSTKDIPATAAFALNLSSTSGAKSTQMPLRWAANCLSVTCAKLGSEASLDKAGRMSPKVVSQPELKMPASTSEATTVVDKALVQDPQCHLCVRDNILAPSRTLSRPSTPSKISEPNSTCQPRPTSPKVSALPANACCTASANAMALCTTASKPGLVRLRQSLSLHFA